MSEGLYNLHSYQTHDKDYEEFQAVAKPISTTLVVLVVIAFIAALVIIIVVVRVCLRRDCCNCCLQDTDSMQDALDQPYDGNQEMSSLEEEDDDLEARLVINMEEQQHHAVDDDTVHYEDNISDEINTAILTHPFTSHHKHLPMELDAITQLNRLHFLATGEDYDENTLQQCLRTRSNRNTESDDEESSAHDWLDDTNNPHNYCDDETHDQYSLGCNRQCIDTDSSEHVLHYIKSNQTDHAEQNNHISNNVTSRADSNDRFYDDEYISPSNSCLEESLL